MLNNFICFFICWQLERFHELLTCIVLTLLHKVHVVLICTYEGWYCLFIYHVNKTNWKCMCSLLLYINSPICVLLSNIGPWWFTIPSKSWARNFTFIAQFWLVWGTDLISSGWFEERIWSVLVGLGNGFDQFWLVWGTDLISSGWFGERFWLISGNGFEQFWLVWGTDLIVILHKHKQNYLFYNCTKISLYKIYL